MAASAPRDPDGLRAELLRRRLSGTAPAAARPDAPARVRRDGPLPLSTGQRQMWFLHQLDPTSTEYLVPLTLRLTGPLDVPALTRAWGLVHAHHEILRTRYRWQDPEPVQIVDPPGPAAPLPVEDLGHLPPPDREPAARARIADLAGRPFDLERDHPIRGLLLRLAPDEHLLLVTVHHIACDAWSAQLFAEEISARYSSGPGDDPGPPPLQYADYAAWERTLLDGPAGRRNLAHWRRALDGLPPLDLPTDRPRPAVRDHRGGAVLATLPTPLTDAVRALAARHTTTPFTVLLAAFQTLLARYTGQDDIPVGTLLSTRNRPEWQRLFGYGVTGLVLRGRLGGDPAFAELLTATRASVLDAFEHQDVSFPRLVAELEPERDRSRTPLFQVLFTLRTESADAYRLPGVTMTPVPAAAPPARFDLSLVLNEARDGTLAARLEYATALFDRPTAERLLDHYVRLLASAVARPATPLSRLGLLGDRERAALLAAAGPRRPGRPVARRLHELFEEQVRRTPHAPAVTAGPETLTYAELNARANRVAHRLIARGAGPDRLVGLCLERDGTLLPALLGVLKSGAAYVPLDPAHPPERLARLLTDTGARTVLTTTALKNRLPPDPDLLLLDHDDRKDPDTDPTAPGDPHHLAYTLHTSGSTGRPKGVAVTHANVVRLLEQARGPLGYGPDDVWSLFHSYAFDVSVFEMWGALLHGGRLVVVPAAVARAPEDFLALLAAEGVTVLSQTPSAFRGLTAALGDHALRVRAVLFAGERLDPGDLRPWTERADRREPGAVAFVNLYGITETTVHTTHHRLTPADLAPGAGSVVGRPLDDTAVHLLDRHGAPVPFGVPGEIHVGGPGVARGYLHRPAATAERFVPDPFGPPGARLYRSGDLARRRPDGQLEFLGRTDDQVKIRGHRVEPGEIANALTAHPAVRAAAVVAREGRLIAYAVPVDRERAPAPGELRARLAASLPAHLVPAAVVLLDALPLTAHGKLDRHALPAPGREDLGTGAGFVAPRTPAEERIAAVWRTVLGTDRVGVEDGFFDAGGDSIRAVALVGALRAAGFDLAVRDVFDHRTVAALAALAAGRDRAVVTAPVRPFALLSAADRARLPEGLADAYPMTQAQIGMTVDRIAHGDGADGLGGGGLGGGGLGGGGGKEGGGAGGGGGGGGHYQNTASTRMRDGIPLDPDALRRAAALLAARHDVLRTSFDLTTCSLPVQLVHPAAEIPLTVRDLRGLGAEEITADLDAFHTAERARPLDLTAPPLLRLTAHRADGGAWWLSVTEFHGIVEGWSYHSLIRELLACYTALCAGRAPAPYTPPAVRFADAVAGERRALESPADRAYWARILDGPPAFSLPGGWGDPEGPVEHFWVSVPFADLEDRLRALATASGAALKSVLVAAHGKVLAALTPHPAFTAGVVVHTRPETADADRVYGMHLNTVPFVFDGTARTWRDLVARAFAHEAALWPHRRFPLPEMQRLAGGRRPVNVLLNHVDFGRLESAAVDPDSVRAPGTTEFDLAVTTVSRRIGLKTSTRFLTRDRAARVAALYRAVLEAMATDPDGPAHLSPVPPAERHRELVTWNTPAAPAAALPSVLELFERRAAATPGATAVRTERGPVLTYAALDARANRLAHWLRGRGVRAESRVAVRLDRGPDLIAALLAVGKAGGAHVPLDPSHPADRTSLITRAAGAALLLDATTLPPDDTLTALPATPPDRAPDDPDRLAYVIFTSGSTGTPKGVEITHRGLANHIAWAARELASRGTGGAPLFSSVAYDLVVPNLWAPLVTGQPVHTVPAGVDLADLGSALAAGSPYSFVKLTPRHLDLLADQLTPEQAAALAPVLVVAGEPFTRATLDRWRALAPRTRLINEYGPTEASVGASVHEVPATAPADAAPAGTLPIGLPLPGTTLYVLDAALEPVPAGVPGELYIGGTGIARGYTGDPARTADRFPPDPHTTVPGARLYRTGDLVRRRADGHLEFLGRLDDQSKIRGFRVEPGEVRAVLLAHPAVRDAFVAVDRPEGADARLIAHCVTDPAQVPGLAAHCRRLLPGHLVPAAFTTLDALPLNANGKIDRRALPAPTATGPDLHVPPRPGAEERIAAVWRRVLERDRVGARDSFFDLGGDSLRAVTLVGALREDGFDLAVRDVFDRRTVAALAALAGERAPAAAPETVAPFALLGAEDRERLPDGLTDAYPMSRTQTGMVVEMLADDRLRRYLGVTSYRVRDERPFEPSALRAAARAVVRRHEALRTSFDLESCSVPVQRVHPEAGIPVSVHPAEDPDTLSETLRAFQAAERARPFTLGAPPLLRLAAHPERGGGGWWLSLVRCHAITEGWSLANLLMELLTCYRRARDGEDLTDGEEPRPAVRYADFIAAEQRSLASAADRAYWAGIVADHPPFVLPEGWGVPRGTPEEERRVRVRLPIGDLEERLRTVASRARASLKSVLLAAHLTVLSGLTGARSFTTGLVCDARPELTGADRVHGMYLNTVPFAHDRAQARGSWLELIGSVFDREVALWPHRRLPMPEIQRRAGGARLVTVSFNHLDFRQVDRELVDVAPTLAEGGTEFDLAVTTLAGHLALSSRSGVLTEASVRRIGAMYRQVLTAMADDPEGPAGTQDFLPPGERALLDALGTPAPAPGGTTLPARIAARAAATPDAPAVIQGTTTVTYAQLTARTAHLARHLRARGVTTGTPVAVLLDREPALVAALLAIWRAGGTHVPLDPALPRERLALLLTDAAAPFLLTRRDTVPPALDHPGTLYLDDVPADSGEGEDTGAEPHHPTHPLHLAYLVHTSGSTGRPKGVQITHRGLAHRVDWAIRAQGLGPEDRVLHKTSAGFDAAAWELFAPLACGGTVVLAPPGAERDPAALLRSVADQRVTVLQVVPSVLRLLTGADGWQRCGSLRLLASAGEQLDGGLAARVRELAPAVDLWNTYGPTECAIDATAHRVPPGTGPGPVPIGRPLPHASARVLDAGLRPVPPGVTGELYLGGAGLAQGYAGRPGLTAGRFVPDPHGPPGARLYRTGDLAVVGPGDGLLRYVGRVDDEVKVNGVRVAPAETRAALLARPGVRDALVVPWRDGRGEQRLVAYVVTHGPRPPRDEPHPATGPLRTTPDQPRPMADGPHPATGRPHPVPDQPHPVADHPHPTPDTLRHHLAATLPAAFVPARIVAVDRIPLTAHGKPDRAALPAPDPGGDRPHRAPATPVERAIAEIWSRVLGLERVGADDGFFAYGGDSLLVVRVIGAARRRGLPLTLRMLHEYDTLSALAAAVDSLMTTEGQRMTPDTPPAPPSPGRRPVPLPASFTADLTRLMAAHRVPGVAVALLRDGAPPLLTALGTTAADRPDPVTAHTPFQVASVSKHVTMLAVLRLVADGVLNLDADIHRYLTTWRVPGGAPITLRELVSHQSGLSHVAPTSHLPTEPMPTIPEILAGRPPAPDAPVRAEHPAGRVFRKTNINFSVLEQLLTDVTGEPFGALMARLVLDPLGLADSTFDQDHPATAPHPVAVGHDPSGAPIPGRWRVRSEVAAGGLWSSAADLATVAREIRRAHRGEPGALIPRPLAQQMLTVWHPGSFYGLGTVVDTTGGDLEYGHGGRTVGYRVGTFTRAGSGEGLIVLTNSENGKHINTFVADTVRRAGGGLGDGEMIADWARADDEPVERAR